METSVSPSLPPPDGIWGAKCCPSYPSINFWSPQVQLVTRFSPVCWVLLQKIWRMTLIRRFLFFFLQEMGKYLFSACAMTLVTTTQQSFQLSSAPTASASSWFGFSRVRLALCMVWYNLPGEVGPLITHGCSLKNNMSLFTASLALPSDDQMSGRWSLSAPKVKGRVSFPGILRMCEALMTQRCKPDTDAQ